jgi:hypothetical protein
MARFTYHTVGYGVFSLLGERYRMGRIEIFDSQDGCGYATAEGDYCMPFEAAAKFEEFIESLTTDLPIQIDIGSVAWCNRECAIDLGIDPELMHDKETKKAYYRQKNDKYAIEQGYKDWDDLLAHSKFGPKNKNNDTSTTENK